jgi:hypothetical protein
MGKGIEQKFLSAIEDRKTGNKAPVFFIRRGWILKNRTVSRPVD